MVGGYKYILIEATDVDGEVKVLLRGDETAEYHHDIVEVFADELDKFFIRVLGGGKIMVDPRESTIVLSGMSTEFGPADHRQSAEMLKEKFPDYTIDIL